MSWSDWQKVEGDGLEFDEILYEKKWHEELEALGQTLFGRLTSHLGEVYEEDKEAAHGAVVPT